MTSSLVLLFRLAGLLGLLSSLAYILMAFVAAAYSVPGLGTLWMGLVVMGISLWLLFTDPDN